MPASVASAVTSSPAAATGYPSRFIRNGVGPPASVAAIRARTSAGRSSSSGHNCTISPHGPRTVTPSPVSRRIVPGTCSPSSSMRPDAYSLSASTVALPTARVEAPTTRSRSTISSVRSVATALKRARRGPARWTTDADETSSASRSGPTDPSNRALTSSPSARPDTSASSGSAGRSRPYRTPASTFSRSTRPANTGRGPRVTAPVTVAVPSRETGGTPVRSTCRDGEAAAAPPSDAAPYRTTCPASSVTSASPMATTPSRRLSRIA